MVVDLFSWIRSPIMLLNGIRPRWPSSCLMDTGIRTAPSPSCVTPNAVAWTMTAKTHTVSSPGRILLPEIPADQSFTAAEVEKEESCYFDEVPPKDGHRKNILDPAHTHVGVGLTLLLMNSGQTQYREIGSSQEFVNRYGRYLLSANEMKPNVPFIFGGVLQPNVSVQCIQLLWEKEPEPIDLDTLRRTVGPYSYSYTNPSKQLLAVFPVPYGQKPNASLLTKGDRFKCRNHSRPQLEARINLHNYVCQSGAKQAG